ncbi:MAG: CpsD/CapB family tyrosine-protein kinase [Bryobacteraceae bacterium]
MSNLFNVLRRENAIDLSDICQEQTDEAQYAPSPVAELANPPARAGAPCRIERVRVSASAPLFPFEHENHAAAEQYRLIRTKILHSPKKPRLLLVSSACSGDGKTVTSINIAASLALNRQSSVLLADADLRRPRISSELGIPAAPGLSEVISGYATLDDALVRAEQFPNLYILPAGNVVENPAELFDSDGWRRMAEQMRSRFDTVVLDAIPAATVADYDLLQIVCDAIVLVVRPDRTDRNAFTKLLETVPKDKLLGVVLNGVEDWLLWKTPAYGYYNKLPHAVTKQGGRHSSL